MIQHVYTDLTTRQNISFGMFGRGTLGSRKDLRDLSNHTVIVVADEIMDEFMVKAAADMILTRGCKNIAFCGEASEDLRTIFSEEDLEINGYEDFAVVWGIEEIEELAEEVSNCWNDVLILCGNMSVLKECQYAMREESWR